MICVVLLALATIGCASNRRVEEGYVEVTGGKIWYRMVGSGPGTPLIVVAGGPGLSHDYLRSLEALSDERPIVFYDQLGSGRSDHPADDQLWTPHRFAMEIDALRDHLELSSAFIFADDWGCVFGSEYLLLQPSGLRGAIFSGPIFSGQRYIADAEHLLDQLPRETRQTIRRHEHDLSTGASEYRDAYQKFFDRFIFSGWNKPSEWNASISKQSRDAYRVLHGSNQIEISGLLRTYDRLAEFDQIKAPVLMTCGQQGIVPPDTAALYLSKFHNARLVVFQQSAHMPIYQEHESFLGTIRAFLHDHDGG